MTAILPRSTYSITWMKVMAPPEGLLAVLTASFNKDSACVAYRAPFGRTLVWTRVDWPKALEGGTGASALTIPLASTSRS